MNKEALKTVEVKIAGMTCGSCELVLERKLGKVPGIVKVNVNYRTGSAYIIADAGQPPSPKDIESAIQEAGYVLVRDTQEQSMVGQKGALRVRIDGMTDQNCERLIKEKLKLVAGVKYASVHYATGTATIHYKDTPPSWEELVAAAESAGFQLRHPEETQSSVEPSHQKWMEIGAALLIIFALYEVLKALDVLSFVSSSTAGAATFGGILLIGLVAGTSSCLAVTGGLLLSVAAKYNEKNQSQSRWQKFKPLLYFNAGRLFSYFILGGLVGILGRTITLSTKMTGYMNIAVALVMFYLALSILKIIPKGSLPIRPPKRLSHWIANISESKNPAAPFGLGMFTFFLPCGFTQSLQLVALASGSFFTGAMTMFVFALGTLPALLGISALSSTTKGKTSRLFLRFSGSLVLVLALFNFNSGLILTGVDAADLISNFASSVSQTSGENAGVTLLPDGTQVINMSVTAYGYHPRSFTAIAGKPTVVKVTTGIDAYGCGTSLTIPAFGLTKFLKPGTVSELGPFTPKKDFLLTCSMGMFRANVKVISG